MYIYIVNMYTHYIWVYQLPISYIIYKIIYINLSYLFIYFIISGILSLKDLFMFEM